MSTALAERLKQETAPAHRRLEALLQLDGELTRERYVEVLQGFAAFLVPWERQLAATLPAAWRPFFDARRRAGRLDHDLQALGAAPAPPRAVPLPDTATLGGALGSIYVIEGSTLGARVIGPRLQARLGLTPEHGASWFAGHGDRTGAMWREFRLALGELPPGPAWDEAACAAGQTFGALIRVFSSCEAAA